ncbi:MAG TPA: tryptophan--tRNA ligase [Acidimicrobiales bacterium]|jgi:tryptophanyl-tRNA synthetase|nr:tryptophan--tRNA ligase [Acidimicrobiales bacterium]
MTRVLSGVQPTGDMHLGGYLGAVRQWVTDQHDHDAFYLIVDLHALTVDHDPAELRRRTLDVAAMLLASGLDPDVCTLFVQSHVPQHTQLTWLLECTATVGELRRMTQFKDKGGAQESVRASLLTYPVLQAADILLYDANRVPVGDDQRQHVELTRDLANRFNHRYGPTFTVPEAAIPRVAARVMDLQEPTRKMSKSVESPQGTIYIVDDPADIERKVKRAVTDSGADVVYDPAAKPGVSNLLELLGAATGRSPQEAAQGYSTYGPLKADVAAALIELLRPVRERHAKLAADPGAVEAILDNGSAKAELVASATYARASDAIGLLPRRGADK